MVGRNSVLVSIRIISNIKLPNPVGALGQSNGAPAAECEIES